MTAPEDVRLLVVLDRLDKIDARLTRMQRQIREAPRRERLNVERIIEGIVAEARRRLDGPEVDPDDQLGQRRARRPSR